MKKIYILLAITLTLFYIFINFTGYSQIISTVAGGGVGDYGLAINAYCEAKTTAIDDSGNLYIADYANRIRKINASTGIITTIAGNGIGGYSGDGLIATKATLLEPTGVALDALGNIYIADNGNNRIRKIDAITGIISTVAGTGTAGYSGDNGLATSANLNNPYSISIDITGNIYIADYYNNRVRKVNANTGIITTIAGDGTFGYSGDNGLATLAKLTKPTGVAFDAAGNIYIVDNYYKNIRKVAISTGIITTVAGGGSSLGDGGAATSALLSGPTGIALDAFDNIYIADYGNNRIRKVTISTGIITTVAGNGTSSSSGDSGIAILAGIPTPNAITLDASGNMYISDNDHIRKVTLSTGIINNFEGTKVADSDGDGGLAISSQLCHPYGIAFDASKNIYIANQCDNRIRKVTANTGIITTIAGSSVPGYNGDSILAASAQLSSPGGITVDTSGNIYIADRDNNRIRKINTNTGMIYTIAILSHPLGITLDASGNIYVAAYKYIYKIDANTGNITTVVGGGSVLGDGGLATSAGLSQPCTVALDKFGNVYIGEQTDGRIRKVTASTGIITTIAGNGTFGYTGDGGLATLAEIMEVDGLVVDGSGNIYISDTYNNRIRKVNANSGIISTIAGTGATNYNGDSITALLTSLSYPMGIILDSFNNIYFSDSGHGRVRKITFPFVINNQPTSVHVCTLDNTSFSVSATAVNSYQWQVNTGSGFINVPNSGIYSGSTTDVLKITGVIAAMNGYTYRCILTSDSNLISNSATLTVDQHPSSAGIISGMSNICQGQNSITYAVPPIANATSYQWILPNGATGVSTNDSITINYGANAVSGYVSVKGLSACGIGDSSKLSITVTPIPASAGTISGITNIVAGQQNIVYSVPLITNATSYVWTLPTGATGSSATNSIVVNYSSSAISGSITVKGHNTCGDGAASTLAITVTPVSTNCSAQFALVADTTTLHHYYIVNNATGVHPLKYNWSWGDGSHDTIAYPSHTYSTAGGYKICLTITDSIGCTNTFCDSSYLQKSTNSIIYVNVIPQGTLGINTNELSNQLKIYPNPAKEILTIETNLNTVQKIEITNLIGQTVFTSYINKKVTVNTSGFANGVYILKLYNDKETVVRKFMKE